MILRYLVLAIGVLQFASSTAFACSEYTVSVTQVAGTNYNPADANDTPLVVQLSAPAAPLPPECENVPIKIEGLPGDPQPLQFSGAGGLRLSAELMPSIDAALSFTSLLLTADARARLVRGQTITLQVGEFRAGQFLRSGTFLSTIRVVAGSTAASAALNVMLEPAMILQLSSADGVEDILLNGDPQTGTSGSTVFFYRTNTSLRVTAKSMNEGVLVHQRGPSIGKIPYNATLDGAPLNFAGGAAAIDFGFIQSNLQSRTIRVAVPPTGPLPAGRYEDVITFSFAPY